MARNGIHQLAHEMSSYAQLVVHVTVYRHCERQNERLK